jgi:predicted regulator of Ras-like GTPase activity (Roadblock/LC7/MglB family)
MPEISHRTPELQMHWFESQLLTLHQLAEAYNFSKKQEGNDIANLSEQGRQKRTEFIEAVQALVNRVIDSPGVTACAAYHDGLILAQSGKTPDTDALGAMIQESIGVAQKDEAILHLGQIQQIVIVGDLNKIAMITVGPIILCVLSPKKTNLAVSLSQYNG